MNGFNTPNEPSLFLTFDCFFVQCPTTFFSYILPVHPRIIHATRELPKPTRSLDQPSIGTFWARRVVSSAKRAKFRCDLCGKSAEHKAHEVDHILPRSQGGSDDETKGNYCIAINQWIFRWRVGRKQHGNGTSNIVQLREASHSGNSHRRVLFVASHCLLHR